MFLILPTLHQVRDAGETGVELPDVDLDNILLPGCVLGKRQAASPAASVSLVASVLDAIHFGSSRQESPSSAGPEGPLRLPKRDFRTA